MDLNKNVMMFSCTTELTGSSNFGDTTLTLDCFGHGGSKSARLSSSKTSMADRVISSSVPDDGCRLVLGLGPTPSSYSADNYHMGVNQNKNSATLLHERMSAEGCSILRLGLSGGIDNSNVLEYSVSQSKLNMHDCQDQISPGNRLVIPVVDEGSTSARKSGGYMRSLLFAPRMNTGNLLLPIQDFPESETTYHNSTSQLTAEPNILSDYSMSTISESATTGTSSERRSSNPKKCKSWGCTKGARGATGLCIGHGGGQRCQKSGCNKGAESRTAYCKAHGGGSRCQHLGCTKSAEGKTDYCIAHGGGKRCEYPGGCTKAARGKSGHCIGHGGGKRCQMEGCTRSAEGKIGLCISHGGGRRCQFEGCTKGAQGSTVFCKAHGGGKRCIFAGCSKGAEGSTPLCKGHGGGKRCLFDGGGICPKSVHGGTNFCVAHGGGKRCAVQGCTKSARGRTDCCVRHGGGKRCKVENCVKSAQGSTDFCKAHGGGKRCNWGGGKCEKFARGKSGLCAAHSNIVQEKKINKECKIGPGLFDGLVSASSTPTSCFEKTHSSSGVSIVSNSSSTLEKLAKRQCLIPPQVLVPLSMKTSSLNSKLSSFEKQDEGRSEIGIGSGGVQSFEFVIPEGRVHGGGLMSLLGQNLKNAIDRI